MISYIGKFKVGDRVRYSNKKRYHWKAGTITHVKPHLRYPIYVKFDKSRTECCHYESELELLDEPIMDVDDLFGEIDI